jgi:hypothetical protein|tara:strand:+ start:1710 stop:2225 length:516 start_codon:yes stop_codon:yes gene_type:complete
MEKINGYFAIVLDKESRRRLRENMKLLKHGPEPRYDITRMDHITIAYKPDLLNANNLKRILGKTCNAFINEYRRNENIEAYFIDLMCYDSYRLSTHEKYLKRIDDGMPHITISHKKELKPKEANSMFHNPTYKHSTAGYVTGKFVYLDHHHGKKPCIMDEKDFDNYIREVA